MTEHSPTPWVVPAGEQNGFIICSGESAKKRQRKAWKAK
jgi:hypothetical protein